MLQRLLIIPVLLFSLTVFAQSVKPIAKMVLDAKSNQPLRSESFFNTQTSNASERPEISNGLSNGTLLYWDEAKSEQIRNVAGQPLSMTLPWENGTTITLDLVPAKNFSSDFQVHLGSTGGVFEAAKGAHYWGIVRGDVHSLAIISVFENEMIGTVSVGENRYTIGALPGDSEKTHVLYKDADLRNNQVFECFTDDDLHRIGEKEISESRSIGPDNCVRMYVETDYTVFQNKGSVANVVTYMTGVFSQVSALYTNESVNLVLHDLVVWDVADPYTGPSASNYLTQFRTAKNGVFNGDLAHLVGIHGLGGVAYVDVLCFPSYGVGYSSINSTYSNVPTYSWTVEVLTHEIGHNLGSSHTHACVWNGNNTAIDGCGPTAGYSEGCTAPLPTNGGTIMSYCHLVSGVGINFNNGFGPQPGDRIRSEVYNAACLTSCGGGGGGCSYVAINSNNFDTNLGIWTDGGTDCARINNATYANSPTYSIQLRDNTNTSVMSTTSQNWTTYDELTVDFSSISVSFENGEDFWLQISTNGGSTYTTVADYNAGTQFSNGVRMTGHVVIPGPFTSTTRLRFRADASADDDQVYIDDVVITGCQQQLLVGNQLEDRNDVAAFEEEEKAADLGNLQISPNPASDNINIRFDAGAAANAVISILDMTGKTVISAAISTVEGFNQVSVPVNQLTNGLYLISIRAGEELLTEKMMIAK